MSGDEVDRLYGLPLEDFVRERDDAARAARKANRRDEAAEIAALPKPTIAAWSVNQLVRQHRREVDLLLDAGQRLVQTQQAALARGGRDELAKARQSHSEAITQLTVLASEILRKRATEQTLSRVQETLRSASISADGRELLARGRLVKETTETGWDILETLEPMGKQPTKPRGAREGRTSAGSLRALRDEQRKAKRERATIAGRLDAAQRHQAKAQRELDEATRKVATLVEALERADHLLREANTALESERARINDPSG